MKKLKRLLLLAAGLWVIVVAWYWDRSPPQIEWIEPPQVLGRKAVLRLRFQDQGKGLRSARVVLQQGSEQHVLLDERYHAPAWIWQAGTRARPVAVTLDTSRFPSLQEGEVQLQVTVTDHPNLWLWSRRSVEQRDWPLDWTPPSLEVLSHNHYIRQGGAELVLFRLSEAISKTGLKVGDSEFQAYPLEDWPGKTFACLLPWRHDLGPEMGAAVFAIDLAHNRTELPLHLGVSSLRFRRRRIEITDGFIAEVAGEILSREPGISAGSTPLETFLRINQDLRQVNHAQIAELAKETSPRLLWSEPFLQLSRSKVEAFFADERTYYYQGEVIDRQTHQGFDLASLARSPVEAANRGKVVWAGYLGIYGNCVVIDHGMGLMSLYGHLSSISVSRGEQVRRGQSLGRTGRSGLAGGDHLHFGMFLHGVQINPLEFWDPSWVRKHIFARLNIETAESPE